MPVFAGSRTTFRSCASRRVRSSRVARRAAARAGLALANLAAVVEQGGERGLDLGRLGQAVGDAGEQCETVRVATQVHANVARDDEQVAHLQQAARLERRTRWRGLRQRGRETWNVRRRQRTRLRAECHQFGQRVEPAFRLRALDGGAQRAYRVTTGLGARQGGDRLQGARKLEGVEIARSHRRQS
jgi:hypothetical protein